MAYDIPPPDQRPESGYYYHFKHDPAGPLNNYAYYIYGVGHHTEDDCRTEDSFMQVYRPLYENFLRLPERRFVRPPTAVHVSQARHPGGERGVRFTKITDPVVITELQALKTRLYADR